MAKPLLPRPTVSLIKNDRLVVFLGDNPGPEWLATDGGVLERGVLTDDGRLLITVRRGRPDDRYKPKPRVNESSGEWRWDANMRGVTEQFGATSSIMESFGDRIIFTVPAERNPKREAGPRKKKAAKPSTAIATVREQVKTMSRESPPPDFKPAIPLREAVDTINAYKAEEGDALELSFSRRGRLKVKYEYGG